MRSETNSCTHELLLGCYLPKSFTDTGLTYVLLYRVKGVANNFSTRYESHTNRNSPHRSYVSRSSSILTADLWDETPLVRVWHFEAWAKRLTLWKGFLNVLFWKKNVHFGRNVTAICSLWLKGRHTATGFDCDWLLPEPIMIQFTDVHITYRLTS